MFELTVMIPGLPKLPNTLRMAHWRTRATHTKEWKMYVHYCTYGRRPEKPLEKAKLTFTRCSTTEPDFDNLAMSFKPVMDGLVECGILVDDNPKIVGRPGYFWEKAKRNHGHIRIKIQGH